MTGASKGPLPDWGALSPGELKAAVARDPVVVLPLAATEQHGPHLPLSTDADIGLGLLEEAFGLLPEGTAAWTLPMEAVGASLEHARFEGTETVTADELVRRIVEVGSGLAAQGVRRLVLSNSHGGNRYAMEAAGLRLRAERDMLVVKVSWPRLERPAGVGVPESEWRHGLHGGALETAMMLHLRPDLVRLDAVADFTSLGAELEGELRRVGPEGEASFSWLAGDLNAAGVVGDATLADAEMGARLVTHYGGALADVILDAAAFPLDRLVQGDRAISERTAWSLLRAARTVPASGDGRRRVEADTAPGAWLDVSPDGSWTASGPVDEEARLLLDLFVPVVANDQLVIGQLGQSLDGRIATEVGASHYVTGSADIERLHRLRALVDAVIVGAATVELDDPRLTVRHVDGADPVRVVLDPSRRLGPASRVVAEAGGPTLVVRAEGDAVPDGQASPRGAATYEEIFVPSSPSGELDLTTVLSELRGRGLRRVLVEGGGLTVSRFLHQGLLDRLHVTVAPMLIGSGRPSITLPPVPTLDEALRPGCRRFILGDDVLFDLDLGAARG